MRTAIIGANSYIARNMIRVNRKNQYSELVLYDYETVHRDGEQGYRQLNLMSQEDLCHAIKDVDLIYFFVGKTGTLQGFEDPETFLKVNELYLFQLLNAYRAVGANAKIVFPSTRLVYKGITDEYLKEDAEKQFLTPYAIQKFACEQYLKMYHNLFGVNYCILRIGVPYGTLVSPVSSYGTLDFLLKQAKEKKEISIFGDGSQKRTFTYIEDLCEILWAAGLNKECQNDVYNIGGETTSIFGLAERVASATGAVVTKKPWPGDAQKIESWDTIFNSAKLDDLIRMDYKMSIDKWLDEVRLTE